ncbi:MAG: Tfp pilus assembly protein FimT/FimU [Caldimicrobium sp.]
MDRKIKGVTLLEVLTVIAIFCILSFFFIEEFINYQITQKLRAEAEVLGKNLNYIKTQSMIGLKPYGFCYDPGIGFCNITKGFCFGMDENGDKRIDEIILRQDLKKDLKFVFELDITNNGTLTCPNAIFFDRRGEIISSGSTGHTITISYKDHKVKVKIDKLGRISIEYPK